MSRERIQKRQKVRRLKLDSGEVEITKDGQRGAVRSESTELRSVSFLSVKSPQGPAGQ